MYMLSVPGTSTSQAEGIRSLVIMLMMVQGTTPKNSSIEVQHCTALMVTWVCFIQPSITAPSLAIFSSAASAMPAVRHIGLDGGELGLRGVVGVLHAC